MSSSRRLPYLLVAIGLLANFLTLAYGVYWHRPMLADGAGWFFTIVRYRIPFYDRESFNRFFPMLWQLPALAWLKHPFPGVDPVGPALRMLEIAYTFHPALSLLLCAWILRRATRLELLVFPVLSFATATQSTLAFSAGVVPDCLSVFWPLFLLVWLGARRSSGELIAIAVLSACLAFTYEAGIALFALLLVVSVERTRRSDGRASEAWVIAPLIAGLGFLGFELLGPHPVYQAGFLGALGMRWAGFRQFALAEVVILGSLAVLLAAGNRSSRLRELEKAIFSSGVIAFVAAGVALVLKDVAFDVRDAVIGRTTAVPFAFMVAGAAWLAGQLDPSAGWLKRSNGVGFVFLVAAALGFSAWNDAATTHQWSVGVDRVRALLAQPGCRVVSSTEFEKELEPEGLDEWSIMPLSVVLAGGSRVNAILYSDYWSHRLPEDPCRTIERRAEIPMAPGPPEYIDSIHKGFLDFDPMLQAMR